MSWWAVDLAAEGEPPDDLAAWLVRRTGQAVQEREDNRVTGFVPNRNSAHDLVREILETFGPGLVAKVRELPDTDWSASWREGIGVRQLGRLAIHPPWLQPPDGSLPIEISPGSAFGTGEHGSTRAALSLMERLVRPGDLVLDLGAGSGILSIAAVRLGARKVIGIEVDADALAVAEDNARRNAVSGQVAFLRGDAAVLVPLCGPAQMIVSNILREVNRAVLPEIRAALAAPGSAIFSGMETSDRDDFMQSLNAAGFSPFDEVVDEGWWAVAARLP